MFSNDGTAERREFCALWDGASELFFTHVEEFTAARQDPQLAHQLLKLEDELFAASWHLEVDENLIVNPNRGPAPDFYYR